MNDESQYVDIKTVSEYFNVTEQTVRNWIEQNIISGRQIGGSQGRYIIFKEESEYLKSKNDKDDTEEVMKELLGDKYSEEWKLEIEE